MSDVHILAIDLAKRSFQVCAADRGGTFVVAPRLGKGFLPTSSAAWRFYRSFVRPLIAA